MPAIRVDNEVWGLLKNHAEPFEDTPNRVLRRLLGLDKKRRQPKRLPAGSRTPQSAYRIPIAATLAELGGNGRVSDVLNRVEKKMKNRLRSVDKEKTSTGMVRWRNSAMWERKVMLEEGLLREDSPRGFWKLSEPGYALLRSR